MFLFPFSNLHELNLDWILSQVKQFAELIPPMESAVEDVSALTEDVQQAMEDAQQAVEDATNAIDIANDAKDIAEQAAQGTIADGAVTTNKIANGAVTSAKLDPAILAYLKNNNIYHVIPDGSGDFTTISNAVAGAADYDTIIVHPGVYNESVHCYNKELNIVGVNRDNCILEFSGLDYANPPLEMAKGCVSNITINCLNSGTPGNSNAYCVHIDSNEEANKTLIFDNVKFYNPVHQTVGIGLRPHFELSFINCTFEAEQHNALYCHDWETSSTIADKMGQKISCTNCTFTNNSSSNSTILLQSQELETNCAECLFIGCSINNKNSSGSKLTMTLWQNRTLTNGSFLGSSDWVLNSSSALNTVRELNANGYPVGENDLSFYNNIVLRTFDNSQPCVLPLSRFQGCIASCNLQGVGFKLLTFYHQYGTNGDEVIVRDIINNTAFSSSYFTISVSSNSVTIAATPTGVNFMLLLAPGNIRY